MLTIKYHTAFKKNYKRLKKRGYELRKLENVITLLAEGKELRAAYRDQILLADYSGSHECHIAPDWLLVYEILENELLLYLTRTGTHSDLF